MIMADRCNGNNYTDDVMTVKVVACDNYRQSEYDVRCDTWSLGITAIEISDGTFPVVDNHHAYKLHRFVRLHLLF